MLKVIEEKIRQKLGLLMAAAAAALVVAAVLVSPSYAVDAPVVQVNTASQIQALVSSLRSQAQAGNGIATAYLAQYPNHYAQLIVRTRSGEVEIHQQFDEMVIMLDGTAKVITGGTPQNPHSVRPGELRSSSVSGGTPIAMATGNILHLVAGTPHQVILSPGSFVAYVDVKVAHANQ